MNSAQSPAARARSFRQEWRDIDRKDGLLFTSTAELTAAQNHAVVYERRVAAARESAEEAERDALYDRMVANVKQAARAAASAE